MEDVRQLQPQPQREPGPQLEGDVAETPSSGATATEQTPQTGTTRRERAETARAAATMAAAERAARLPERGLRYALITGVIMGVLVALLNVVLILLSAGLFREAHQQVVHDALTVRVALLLASIFGVSWLLAIVVAFVGGLILGRIAVRRRLGFLAGALGGVLYSLILWPISFIPAYPGNLGGPATLDAGSLVLELVWCLLWGLGGALVCLFGAWVASARHPHYRER